jgi:hypothetical protein
MFGALHVSRMVHAWLIVCVLNHPSRVWYRMYDVNVDGLKISKNLCSRITVSTIGSRVSLSEEEKH